MGQKLYIVFVGSLMIATASCSTVNQYVDQAKDAINKKIAKNHSNKSSHITEKTKQSSATEEGEIVVSRPVVGLVMGHDSRDKRTQILISSGTDPLVEENVRYYMDLQEVKLREYLLHTGVSISRQNNNVILNMPSHISFQQGVSTLDQEFLRILDSVISIVHENEKTLIEVVGHTDSIGSEAYNQNLSLQRAKKVADYFVANKCNPIRIGTYGYGEKYPIADNTTQSGRMQNRRVEIALVPISVNKLSQN